MAILQNPELKSGQRPQLRQEKSYKQGDDLFVEGERGNEMFIIDSGEVAILKKSEDGMVQLAKLTSPSSIGEMALLDDMPRSATVRALTPTRVTVINRLAFNAVLEKVPLWLRSIVKIITSRLRDANARVGKCILRDMECGLTIVLGLMAERYGQRSGDGVTLSYNMAKNFAMFTSRMSTKNFQVALESLSKRGILTLEKDTEGHSLIAIKDLLVLTLFEEYRKLKAQGKKMAGIDLTDKHHEFLSNMTYVSQKNARQTPDGIFLPMVAIDFGEEKENRRILGELQKKNLLQITLPGQYGDEEGVLYEKGMLGQVRRLKTWYPAFEMVVESAKV